MCPVLNYTYIEHFLRTIVRVLFALLSVVLLEHSFSMTAAQSLLSPTPEKSKTITDLFLTLPKPAWSRDAIGSYWPLLFPSTEAGW